ncbi:MOSC N-terminal beta barrel domain-containing protein [Rothia aerolata]|uniref:MOSC domain-containing protein n=1 Tax=Rothia aerolata TaxID=1812262 RepID=A0A917MT12_9MICC|nr:MOSC N-terminal beta barrel domain-containing protein [Rothia aerolata]GGH61888.1 hypothetical protein GCM10007359_11530 [Rothia aerolata]
MRTLNVESYGFSPLKSVRHLPFRASREPQHPADPGYLATTGPVGDRRFCLVDLEKKAVLRTIGHLELMQVVCTYRGQNLAITIPGQPEITLDLENLSVTGQLTCDYWGRETTLQLLNAEANRAFSAFLKKPVTLAQAQPNEVVYGEAFTLIGSATLDYLGAQLKHPLLQEHARIRSTFLVETEEPFEEETWQGQPLLLQAKDDAGLPPTRFIAGEPLGRCAVVDANPETGERDLPLFKLLSQTRPRNRRGEPVLGIYLALARGA